MFIYHFNRLIRNRILWGFFAILIAFAFVAVDSCFRRTDPTQAAGTINGKRISYTSFDETVQAIRGIGRNRDNETSADKVDRRAWEQIAARLTAEKNGMGATPEEVRTTLAEAPAFQGTSGFDINRYRIIIAEQGLTPDRYERIVAQQIALMKTAALIESATWIAPMVLDDELTAMTDRFTVQAASVSNQFATLDMQLSDDNLNKYYEDNKESFALPDRVSVNYAAFPVTNYLALISVPEEDLQEYYDSNINSYTRTTTNDTSETIPFAEVRDKILDELKLEEARYCASTSITFAIYGKLTQESEDVMATTAKNADVVIKKSPLFSIDDHLYWADNAKELASTAFELDPERSDQRYGIVKSDNFIYVISLADKSPAHTPEFKDVLETLRPRALAKARSEAFQDQVKDLRAAIRKLLDEGKSFEEAAKAKALNVTTSLTYSVNEIQQQSFSNSFSIAYGAMTLKKGELSEAVPASATQSLLIYVQNREPGDALAAEMMRAQIRAGIARRNQHNLFDKWLGWNLAQQNFKPARPLADPDTAPEIEEP